MTDPLEEVRQQSGYRRGTVMGLTAAEAFMLIAFILLTLLVFWRATANAEKEKLLAEKTRLETVIAGLGSPEAVVSALQFQERFNLLTPEVMEERLALMEDEDLRSLVQEARTLPQEGLLELTDLTRDGAFPGAKEKIKLFDEVDLRPDEVADLQAELTRARDDTRMLEEDMAALETQLDAFADTGVTPESIQSMQTTLKELGERQKSLARTGADIAATIREKAGDRIAALGGRVLPDGDVIFPDAVLFDAGRDEIKPEFDTLLKSFCRLWFETLYDQRDALDTVQVEGHASSEYGSLDSERAFVANLDLSQRRAAAVFARCLSYGGGDAVTEWARGAMAAVGYSSSRAIIENGAEDRAASRRVVFALEPKTESQMTTSVLDAPAAGRRTDENEIVPSSQSEPPGKVTGGPEYFRALGYTALAGRVTDVRDGDTIVLGDQPIRLEGLHAPERDTDIGQRAHGFMDNLVAGRVITCWLNGDESHDRKVGVCFLGPDDLAAQIIQSGLGRDCPAFSHGRYAGIEQAPARETTDLPGYCLKS